MSETRQQILNMLQDGKISAEEAMELLAAVEPADTPESEPGEQPDAGEEVLIGEVVTPSAPPDLSRFRRFWQIPFFISLAFLLLSGLWLRSLYKSSAGAITLGFVCLWSIFIFAVLLTTLAWLSRRAPWIHVRVQEQHGRRIAISLPVPLGLADWGVSIARTFVSDKDQASLEMAAAFLKEARQNLDRPGNDPLFISVDDDDGDQVQVYIG